MSFDRPLALLSLAVLAVLAAGFVTLARRRPRVRRPLPERRRPALRLDARERRAAVCAARARHRRARPPRRRDGRAARDEVGAGRERNRRAGRRHLAVDALDRRPADAAGCGQDSGRRFLERAPEKLRVGLVTFSGDVSVGAVPTRDRERVRRSVAEISRWQAGGGTAIGDALARAVELGRSAFGETGGTTGRGLERSPRTRSASSSSPTGGRIAGLLPPAAGASRAAEAGIPVFTVALGTDRPDGGGGGAPGSFGDPVRRLQPRPGPGDAPGDRRGDGRRVLRRAVGGGARVGLPPARLRARSRGPADRGDGALRGRRCSRPHGGGRARASRRAGSPVKEGRPPVGTGPRPPIARARIKPTPAGCSG